MVSAASLLVSLPLRVLAWALPYAALLDPAVASLGEVLPGAGEPAAEGEAAALTPHSPAAHRAMFFAAALAAFAKAAADGNSRMPAVAGFGPSLLRFTAHLLLPLALALRGGADAALLGAL